MPGGWVRSSAPRKLTLPADWPERRFKVRLRAGGRCERQDGDVRCPAVGTDCDHIVRGNNHDLENLQWLCREHHNAKTSAEGNAARPRLYRDPEPHPGLRR